MVKYIPSLIFAGYLIALYWTSFTTGRNFKRKGYPLWAHSFYIIPSTAMTIFVGLVFYVEFLKYY